MPTTPERPVDRPITLRSLAPSYEEDKHGIYVTALTRALRESDDVRNIALTGAYGTGKSSVLKRLSEIDEFKDRVLELSLSTVGVTEKRPKGDSDTNPAEWTKTNLIQKEIVKQILYRDAPTKTRGSRFRRISRFRWAPEIGSAIGVGALLLAILWITGLALPFAKSLGEDPAWGWLLSTYVALLAILSGIVYAIRWLTHNRVFLEKLSAGPATVSLAANSSNYFDQYMDEIVYYFEQSGRDIVIFEDIDRFEDAHIFETLRALNTLLNGAEQVQLRRRLGKVKLPKGTPTPEVKFVYALRDSVFERLSDVPTDINEEHTNTANTYDNADDEVKRANRTKFFDLVIPIVPFITHRNARDLMLNAMDGTGVSRELINVAAGFVADMRLIIDMRNEYDVYANRLLATKNQMPGLDPDRLFALIIYKCVHMADFEAIRFGKSDLDELRDAWRSIVRDSLADSYEREKAAIKQLALEGLADARAQSLGDRLEAVARALTPHQSYLTDTVVLVAGQGYQGDELRKAAFWNLVIDTGGTVAVYNPRLGTNIPITFQQLQVLLGQTLQPDEWKQIDRQTQLRARRAARDDITFLRHHEWGEIYGRREFANTTGPGGGETMAKATERILRSRLARALVAAGYLNEYFALYVSIYYGEHLRPRAINYVVHALDRGVSDINYPLEPEDVEAIIGDKGVDIFRDRASYNISILDHLLEERPPEAEMVVRQIVALDRDDWGFVEAYILAGGERVKFIRMLAPLIPESVAGIVAGAPEDILVELVDAALDYAGANISDNISGEFNRIVLENYENLPSIRVGAQPKLEPDAKAKTDLRKHQTIDAIAKLGLRLPATAPLTTAASNRTIELGAYELNSANIADLTGQPSLSLDAIRTKSEAVFNTALERMAEYVALIIEEPGAVTISDEVNFIAILEHACRLSPNNESLDQIVRLASEQCRVDRLDEAPQAAWPIIAATKRTSPAARNLLTYLDGVGTFDDSLGALLVKVTNVDEPDAVAEADRIQLAVSILNARDAIPSPVHRVQLAVSLNPPAYIATASLIPESGELAGLMIQANLIPDDATTFASSVISDWPTREAALAKSAKAQSFLTPASLPPAQLGSFFSSSKVPSSLKDVVIANLPIFIAGADSNGVRAMGTYAVASRADLPFVLIDQLRAGGAADPVVAALLGNASFASLEEVRAELRALGNPYPLIADRGTARPVLPDDEAHRKLLDLLKAAEIVSDHKPDRGGRRVSLRRP